MAHTQPSWHAKPAKPVQRNWPKIIRPLVCMVASIVIGVALLWGLDFNHYRGPDTEYSAHFLPALFICFPVLIGSMYKYLAAKPPKWLTIPFLVIVIGAIVFALHPIPLPLLILLVIGGLFLLGASS